MTRFASWRPDTALSVASLAGYVTRRSKTFTGIEHDLRRLLEPVVGDAWQRATQSICRAAACNRVLSCLVRGAGYGAVGPLLTADGLARVERLRQTCRPTIIAVLHNGPIIALHSALHLLEIPAAVLSMRHPEGGPSPLEVITIRDAKDDHSGLSHLKASMACRKKLLAGGIVFIPMDGTGTVDLEVGLLGRRIGVPGGAAVLATMTGAQIVPAEAKWRRDNKIDLIVGDPYIAGDEGPATQVEHTLLKAVMADFDRRLRDDPSQLNLTLVDLLLDAPALHRPDA